MTRVTPSDATDSADPDAVIELEFSEAVASASVTLDTIKVYEGTTEVAGTIEHEGDTATFTPTARLALLAEYRIEVSSEIRDLDGTEMADDFSSTFTVRDGVWSEPEELPNAITDGNAPIGIGSDANGNVLVAWQGEESCYLRWRKPRTEWDSELVQDLCTKISVSAAGDAILTYGSPTSARQYRNGTWLTGEPINENCTYVFQQGIAPSGEAHVLCSDTGSGWWPFHTDSSGDWVRSGTAWNMFDQGFFYLSPIAFDAGGNGFVVWPIAYSRYNQEQGT